MKSTLLLISLFVAAPASAQSEALIEQVGSGNLATLTQLSAAQLGGSVATIRQENNGAGGHIALLTQSGGAFADILQTGSFNRLLGLDGVSAALSLDGSELFLMQSGTNNTAFVEQAAGAYASITQSGTNNTATVYQSGGVSQ